MSFQKKIKLLFLFILIIYFIDAPLRYKINTTVVTQKICPYIIYKNLAKYFSLLTSPPINLNDSNLNYDFKKLQFGSEISIKNVKIQDSININNFKFDWGTVDVKDLKEVGAAEIKGNRLWYINQDDANLIEKLRLSEKISHNGGIKSIISIGNKKYVYVTYVNKSCASARLVDLDNMEIVLQFSCLPNSDKVDLNGSGGGFLKLSDNEVLFATGTPSGIETDIEINQYAQRNSSLWGKILKLSLEKDKIKVKMYTKGHRNPQGINQIGKRIFAVEHGPMGGDEINEIKEGMNYGWPIQSLGSHYDSKYINKSYSSPYATQHSLLAFLPSIGISYINECPQVYSKYFSPNECLAVSSMREKAIFLVIFKNESILFYEKIQLNSRIRKFFVQDNTIIAVTDFNGIIVGNLNSLSI